MKTIALYIMSAATIGCASVGTPIARQNIPRIQKGVTTQAELVSMFGSPSDKTIDSNGNVRLEWVHSAAQAKA